MSARPARPPAKPAATMSAGPSAWTSERARSGALDGGTAAWFPAAAVVGFSGRVELWWLRALKPGFRHCVVALAQPGGGWVLVDPMAHATRVTAIPGRTDPVGWFLAHELLPVPVRPRPPELRAAPWAPFTCVEAVKRALGIRARFVFTPWQLFRHLTEGKKKVLDSGPVIGL